MTAQFWFLIFFFHGLEIVWRHNQRRGMHWQWLETVGWQEFNRTRLEEDHKCYRPPLWNVPLKWQALLYIQGEGLPVDPCTDRRKTILSVAARHNSLSETVHGVFNVSRVGEVRNHGSEDCADWGVEIRDCWMSRVLTTLLYRMVSKVMHSWKKDILRAQIIGCDFIWEFSSSSLKFRVSRCFHPFILIVPL